METKGPAVVARETMETLFATKDVSTLDAHPGMESLRKIFPAFIGAFPDIKIELQQQVIDGNKVASHWLFLGTHLGNFHGIQPTGKAVRFQNINIIKVEGEKVVQYNSEIGWLAILMQIGFLPFQGGGNK